jgi:LysM repeat protein
MRRTIIAGLLLAAVGLFSGCGGPSAGITPTVEALIPSETAAPTITLTASPTATAAEVVEVPTNTLTPTAAPPTETPLPTATLGPYEHTVAEGDSLITIVQQYGYTDLRTEPGSIIDQIVQINDNILSADILPPPGSLILIPRQTPTPTPENPATLVSMNATNTASAPNVVISANAGTFDYTVQENDTIIQVAAENNLTLEQIWVLNPDLNFFGCNFEIPSGGPDCIVSLRVGQVIKLPAPTPTPTLSPTPSGNETLTPTPTRSAPMLVYPPDGAVAQPGVFSLRWVSVGILEPQEFYLVEVTDHTLGVVVFRAVTKDTSATLPDSIIPNDGQTHDFTWKVWIATPNAEGVYLASGGTSMEWRFQWLSR